MSTEYHLLVVEGYVLLRDILIDFFSKQPECMSSSGVQDVATALEYIRRHPVDLILSSGNLPGEPAISLLNELALRSIEVPVLILSAGLNHFVVRRLLGLGAAGVVWNTSTLTDLSACVRAAVQGGTWQNNDTLRRALGGVPRQLPSWAIPFSERQAQVLRGIAAAQANKEIAARLGVSESSVKCTVQQIFGKTGVRSRSELVRVVLERFPDGFVTDLPDSVHT